jgi:hypothetical protein
LTEFGFASPDAVEGNGAKITPREIMVTMMDNFVPPIEEFMAPPKNKPPNWVREFVTEVRSTKDGTPVTYRLGIMTVKGELPTGVAPALAAIWLRRNAPPLVYTPRKKCSIPKISSKNWACTTFVRMFL